MLLLFAAKVGTFYAFTAEVTAPCGMYADALNLRRTFSLFRNTGPALPSMSPLSGAVKTIASTISHATGKRTSDLPPFVLQ